MRRTFNLSIAAIALFIFLSETRAQQTARTTPAGTHYLQYLPSGYNSNLDKYPVVIFLHGIGEKGNTASDVWKVAKNALPKYVQGGTQYPFILISPQLETWYGMWTPAYVMEVVNHVKRELRIDESRVYLTGLSLGGFGVWRTAGAYPSEFAAIGPVCSGGNDLGNACKIAAANLPVWGFHGDKDGTVSYTVTTTMINAINVCTPKPNPLAKVTIFPGMGHNVWDKAYRETDLINWLLSYRKGTDSGTSPTNKPPVVSAGSDKTITLPANSLEIQGSASDPDGTVSSWQWTKTSGGQASLSNTTSSKLKVSNLLEGTYTFRLTVKDNGGASAFDEVKVTVKSGTYTTNKPPVANAGPDKTTTANYNTIVGSASDPDGSIASYQWTKVSGGSAELYNANTPKLFAKNLSDGVYVFRLTVKDNKGATASDEMKLTVGSGIPGDDNKDEPVVNDPSNIKPIANAGPDKTTTNRGFTVVGSASDKDGNIVSVQWRKLSGPGCSLANTNTLKLWAYDLSPGVYVFQLTVTDNDGATAQDDMRLVVNSSSTKRVPFVDAGTDKVTTNNGFTLVGKARDEDGTISSYLWKKLSGPNVPMKNETTPKLWIYDLIKGTYEFRFMATDNDGLSAYDDVRLEVK